eukprot:Gb_41765 [translate_table: standard]
MTTYVAPLSLDALQALSAVLSYTFNSIDEHFSPSNQGGEKNTSTQHNKDAIINSNKKIEKECQALSAKESPLEMVKTKEGDLRRLDSDEIIHPELMILNRQDCDGNLLETTTVQSDISQQFSCEEIESQDKDDGKEMVANETRRTNKVVRAEVDVQSTGFQCVGSRITKTPYRKNSPLNWFPRKKTESYLERKIRMLQEAEGTKASLDETLVGSNIRLSRVEREKRAVQAAAKEAMETRKAALVEASWCRILEAARIPCSLAVMELEKAEKKASEALATAVALGVIMKNGTGSSKHSCEGETSSSEEGSNHTVTASFETAFEVDKEVVAAVKVAFGSLAHLPDFTLKDPVDADESKRRDQNQVAVDVQSGDIESSGGLDKKSCSTEGCSKVDIQPYSELDREEDAPDSIRMKTRVVNIPLNNRISKELPSPLELSDGLVKLMLERMKYLTSEELASLEQIVSTRGLGALLKEQNVEQEANVKNTGGGLADMLVKHVSRLEAEKTAGSKPAVLSSASKVKNPSEDVPDLGSVLVKHMSKLEKELQEAKRTSKAQEYKRPGELGRAVQSLDQVLIKHVSRLEREKLAAAANSKGLEARKTSASVKSCTEDHNKLGLGDILKKQPSNINAKGKVHADISNKENKDVNPILEFSLGVKQTNIDALKCQNASVGSVETSADNCEERNLQSDLSSLDAHFSKYEESRFQEHTNKRESKEQIEGLDKVLIKRMSRLEKEKLEAAAAAKTCEAHKSSTLNKSTQDCKSLESSRLGRMNVHDIRNNYNGKDNRDGIASLVENSGLVQSGNSCIESACLGTTNAEKMERSKLSSTNVPDLGSILIKHVSKFQEEIQAAKTASQTVKSVQRKQSLRNEESLDKVLVKRLSKLEREKLAASAKEASLNSYKCSTTSSDAFEAQPQNQIGEDCVLKDVNEMIGTSNKADAESRVSNMEVLESSCSHSSQEKQAEDYCLHSEGNNHATETSEIDPFHTVKKMSKLEIEKQQAAGNDPWQRRRNTRAEELQAAWGGLGLENSMKRHVSRLELEQFVACFLRALKAAWRQAEEEERRRAPHY